MPGPPSQPTLFEHWAKYHNMSGNPTYRFFRCCDVYGNGTGDELCWVCNEKMGIIYSALDYDDPGRLNGSGVYMQMSKVKLENLTRHP